MIKAIQSGPRNKFSKRNNANKIQFGYIGGGHGTALNPSYFKKMTVLFLNIQNFKNKKFIPNPLNVNKKITGLLKKLEARFYLFQYALKEASKK